MTRVGPRAFGVGLLLLGLVFYDAAAATITQRLIVPAVLSVGAWLLIQNLMPVLLVICMLAALHTDLASADLITSRILPGIATGSGIALLIIAARRFRARIHATRAARWNGRSGPRPRP